MRETLNFSHAKNAKLFAKSAKLKATNKSTIMTKVQKTTMALLIAYAIWEVFVQLWAQYVQGAVIR